MVKTLILDLLIYIYIYIYIYKYIICFNHYLGSIDDLRRKVENMEEVMIG